MNGARIAPPAHTIFMCLPATALFLAALLLAARVPTSQAQSQESVVAVSQDDARALYRISELQMFAETFRGDFVKLWEAPSSSISPARAEVARRQVDKHFSAAVLEPLLVEQFGVRSDATEAKAVLKWAAGPVGQSITGRPRTPHDSDLVGALEAYGKANSTAPVEQTRVKILAELSKEALLDQVYISSTSVAALLVSLTLTAAENPTQSVPPNAWDQFMPGLFARAAESRSGYLRAAASVLQVEHEHASNSDLEAYLAFRESPNGRWLSREAAGALLAVLRKQQQAYTDDVQRIFAKIQ